MQRQMTEQEMVVDYVKRMDIDQLMAPIDREKIAAELNIQNPIVILMVEAWIDLRRKRLVFERDVYSKVVLLEKEVAKFHSVKAKYDEMQIGSEDDWEEDSDEELKQYELQGKAVSRSDVHNLLHFATKVNLMEDETRMRY